MPQVKLGVRWVHLALNWILNCMAHLFKYCSHYGLLRHQKSVFYSQQLDSEIINQHTLLKKNTLQWILLASGGAGTSEW